MCGSLDAVWGDGTIGMLGLGLVALLLWSPAWAAVFFTAPSTSNFLRHRHAPVWLSRGVASGLAGLILLIWVPVYVTAIFLFLDAMEATFFC